MRAPQSIRRDRLDVAVRLMNARAQLFQPENVQIDGPRADGAAARQRNPRARPQRATSGPSTRLEARMVFTSS